MQQLQETELPLDKKVSKKYFKKIHCNLDDASRVMDHLFEEDELTVFDYATFGMCYSSGLAEKYRYEDYRSFVEKYNYALVEAFKTPMDFIKEVYSYLGAHVGFHKLLGSIKLHIDDKTDIFKGEEFKSEADLERILFASLKNWTEEWTVSRQRNIGHGKCDIDVVAQGEKLAIELKKSHAQRKDVYQTVEYANGGSGYAAVLIAKRFDDDTIQLANDLKVVCYEYLLAREEGAHLPYTLFLERKNQPRKLTNIELMLEEMDYCDGHLIDFKGIPTSSSAFYKSREMVLRFHEDLLQAANLIASRRQAN